MNYTTLILLINEIVPDKIDDFIIKYNELNKFLSKKKKVERSNFLKGNGFNKSRCINIDERYATSKYISKIIPVEIVIRYPNKNWNWGRDGLSSNDNITIGFIEKYIDKNWDWSFCGLSSCNIITLEFIEKHIERDWDWAGLSCNPNITSEFIERHLDKPWSWFKLSRNPIITPEFIERNMNKNWYWGEGGISFNPTITSEFVESHLDKDWDWDYLLHNGNISIRFYSNRFNKIKNHNVLGEIRIPILTPKFKKELKEAYLYKKYKPQSIGYKRDRKEYEVLINKC